LVIFFFVIFQEVSMTNPMPDVQNHGVSQLRTEGSYTEQEKEEFTTEFHRVTRSNKEKKKKNLPQSFTELHGAIKKEKEEFTTENTEEHGVFI
jgi:hypothetical protein